MTAETTHLNNGEDWRVLCVQPTYGHVHPDSHKAHLVGGSRRDGPTWNRCDFLEMDRSLLANCFNYLWCHALNMREAGQGTKYFMMLHPDVCPEDGFRDILYEDLEASGADVMAAVLPIKDMRGLTTTALDDPDDRWGVLRRLTTREVHNPKVPEVFSAADLGYPDNMLLMNTGCWMARLDRPWCTELCPGLDPKIQEAVDWLFGWLKHSQCEDRTAAKHIETCLNELFRQGEKAKGFARVFFTIRDAIHRCENGMWAPCVSSEDWEFSRMVGRAGGKVMGTRRVKLNHMGRIPYSNREGWGDDPCDMQWGRKFGWLPLFGDQPVLDPYKGHGPSAELPGVEGWLSDEEGAELSSLAAGKNVLEIGSYKGRSTIWLARTAKRVVTVDTFQCVGIPKGPDTYQEFTANLRRFKVDHKVTPVRGWSHKVVPKIEGKFDLCFIDGSHDASSVARDALLCGKVLKPDGLLAFHDYERPEDPGVKQVVDLIVREGGEIVRRVDFLVVVRPPLRKEVKVCKEVVRV